MRGGGGCTVQQYSSRQTPPVHTMIDSTETLQKVVFLPQLTNTQSVVSYRIIRCLSCKKSQGNNTSNSTMAVIPKHHSGTAIQSQSDAEFSCIWHYKKEEEIKTTHNYNNVKYNTIKSD